MAHNKASESAEETHASAPTLMGQQTWPMSQFTVHVAEVVLDESAIWETWRPTRLPRQLQRRHVLKQGS